MEHTKHIIRAVLLLILAVVVMVVLRHFILPNTFGEHGHYRFASVADIAAMELVHGEPGVCAECHEDEALFVSEGAHATVSCEVCHAPLSTHVEGGERSAEMRVQRTHALCAGCHQRLVSRPATFPQIVVKDHVIEKGGDMTPDICLECHDAHEPVE